MPAYAGRAADSEASSFEMRCAAAWRASMRCCARRSCCASMQTSPSPRSHPRWVFRRAPSSRGCTGLSRSCVPPFRRRACGERGPRPAGARAGPGRNAATGDDELDAAAARAAADVAAIREGLALLADELPLLPEPAPRPRLRAGGAWGSRRPRLPLRRGGDRRLDVRPRRGDHRAAVARDTVSADTFDYRPGAVGGGAAFPFLGYSVPELSDISASSADDAWVVGGVAWHWDGRRWRSVTLPSRRARVEPLVGCGARAGRCLGGRLVERSDGTRGLHASPGGALGRRALAGRDGAVGRIPAGSARSRRMPPTTSGRPDGGCRRGRTGTGPTRPSGR